MCNVSIRNKYFELISFNTFIYLFILLINSINYIQVKYIENSMEKYVFRHINITFCWKVEPHIYINIKNLEYRKIFPFI